MNESRKTTLGSGIKFVTSDQMVVNILISTAIGLVVIAVAVGLTGDTPVVAWVLSAAAISVIGGIRLALRGMVLPGRILIPLILTIATGFIAYTRGGLYHIGMLGFPVVTMLAGLLIGIRGSLIFAGFASLISIFIGYAEINGFAPFSESSRAGYEDIAVAVTLIFLTALILRVLIRRFTESLQEAEAYGEAQEKANTELKNLQLVLEQRVAERTAQLNKRANQLEAISNVARSTTSLQNLEELLPAITNLVSDRFDCYHTGIFLIEDNRDFAVLSATNSTGGNKMLARQHKVKLGTNSIVGNVISHGMPRVALDVGPDAVSFDNPNLPDTHSEIALPLRAGGRLIGALDVQSTQQNAFTQEDVAILSTLADQVAIAIENARLFSEARQALKNSEDTFARYIKQEWSGFVQQIKNTGYLFDGKHTIPLFGKYPNEKSRSLPQTGRLTMEKDTRKLLVPLRLRGQTIGVLEVKPKNGNRQWTRDDLTLLEAAAERAALALENARLVNSAQRRAAREQTIGEISTRIGATTELEAIMQSAVEELGRRIGGAAEVILEFDSAK